MPIHEAKPSSTISVRSCTQADAARLALIGAATFLETYAGWLPGEAILEHCLASHTAQAYEDLLAGAGTYAWLAEKEGAPVGYALLTPPHFPGIAAPSDLELKRLYLFSRFHGTGSGRELLEQAVREAKQRGAERLLLGTHADNKRALDFYRRNGFAPIATRTFKLGQITFEDPVLARRL